MKKIIFYCSDPELKSNSQLEREGGSGTLLALLNLARQLVFSGFSVELLGDCTLLDKTEENDIFFKHIKSDSEFINLCVKHNYDYVVIVGHASNIFDYKVKLANKVVYWAHNWIDVSKIYRACKYEYIDKVVFVSRYHFFRSWRSLRFNPLALKYFFWIHNSIDIENSQFIMNYKYKKYEKDGLKVAFLSFPSVNKGFPQVISIIDQLRDRGHRVELNVFGTTKLYSSKNIGYGECERFLFDEEGRCRDGVVLHGMLGKRELFDTLDHMDIAIAGMTGSETFCYALIESLARGVIAVSLNKGGQIDYIKNGSNGYLVSDPLDAVNKIIKYLHEDEEKVFLMKENCISTVKKFSKEKIAKKWVCKVFK